ncbi:hypothetical protein [Cytobacillus firmus]|uniref:hypothetical protein n=1 Tax=Cytobacillus firmus TaxID=1399 RepID=UPI003000FCCE
MESITINVPRKVENNVEGFEFLTKLIDDTKNLYTTHILLEFKNTRWFEANLVAILGAWVQKHRNVNKISFSRVSKSIRKVFLKNGFYEKYNVGSEVDLFGSTIPYKIFNISEHEEFIKYIMESVIPKIKLNIETKVAKGFISSLSEVFANVERHAKSVEMVTCGQYYYAHQKVCFTIVDFGKTIGNNVKHKLGNPYMSDSEAIDWATKWGNTTKEHGEPGGIGLHIIDEFLKKNGGVFQILSGFGYWEKQQGSIFTKELNSYFPGTVVNIQSSLDYTFEDDSILIVF